MKHKLLSLFALAGAMLASASVWAQDEPTSKWADPVKPSFTFPGDWATPEIGGKYYIYNVGSGLFLGGGQTWGTRGIVLADSVVLLNQSAVQINNTQGNTSANYVLPFELVNGPKEGQLNINVLNNSKASSGAKHFVGEDGAQAWIDGDAGRNTNYGAWTIAEYKDGYMIQNVNASTVKYAGEEGAITRAFGVDGNNTNGSWATTWTDLWIEIPEGDETAAATLPWLVWKFVDASNGEIVRAYSKDIMKAYTIYNAKIALHATLDAADAAGVSESDINAAVAVYLSETVTEAEVLAANTALQLAITLQGQEPPVEITSVLQNPDFELGNISGWETDYVSGKQAQNIGYQGANYTNGDVTISKFIEAWKPGAPIGDGYLQQTIYGLPAGKYRLECDAIAVRQGQTIEQKGAYLFIQAGILEEKTTMSTGDGLPEHFVVEFENDGAPAMTFGMKTESATVNWIAADNFQLYYDGALTESPHYKQLQKYLEEVELAYSADDTYCNATAKAALNSAIEEADGITTDATDAECDSAYNQLKRAYDAVTASVKVYQSLYEAVQAGGKLDEYETLTAENGWGELSQKINDLKVNLETAYYEGSLADDEVADAIKGVLPLIRTWVSENISAITPGSDLTILLENADFSEGQYGRVADDNVVFDGDENSIPGWTITRGNISELSGTYHNIEAYHKGFDFNQTIPNMPAGVYLISVQGFVRIDSGNNDMELYAGISKNAFMRDEDEYSEVALLGTDGTSDGTWPNDKKFTGPEGVEVYCPNSMQGAKIYFDTENPMTGKPFYQNNVKIIHTGGDLTIGVRCSATGLWILWDNFHIEYLGDGGDDYVEMAGDKLNELTAVYEDETNSSYLTAKAVSDYKAISTADWTNINSMEAYLAFAAPCDSLIKYIKEGTELGTALSVLLNDYETRYACSETAGSDFEDLRQSMYDKLENVEFADNAEMESAPEVLAKAWASSILDNVDTSIFGNATEIIYSPDYLTYAAEEEQTSTSNGWTWELEEGATFGNARAADRVAEVWNAGGEFKHYQKLTGLKEGYYRLTVNGWFRPSEAFSAAEHEAWSAISRAFMFGESSEDNYTKLLKNVLAYGEIEDPGIEEESTYTWTDGEEEVSVYTPSNCPSSYQFFDGIFAEVEPTELEGEDVDQPTYRNTLDVKVGADGVLTIGISNKGLYVEGKNNDFVVFSNWTLSYLGTEAPVGIAVVDAKTEKAPAVIYTIDGRQASRLQRGLNIVRNADGNVQKVLVK